MRFCTALPDDGGDFRRPETPELPALARAVEQCDLEAALVEPGLLAVPVAQRAATEAERLLEHHLRSPAVLQDPDQGVLVAADRGEVLPIQHAAVEADLVEDAVALVH